MATGHSRSAVHMWEKRGERTSALTADRIAETASPEYTEPCHDGEHDSAAR